MRRKAIVKVLDFGLAKAGFEQKVLDVPAAGADDELMDSGPVTQAGQLLGTPTSLRPSRSPTRKAPTSERTFIVWAARCTTCSAAVRRFRRRSSTTYSSRISQRTPGC